MQNDTNITVQEIIGYELPTVSRPDLDTTIETNYQSFLENHSMTYQELKEIQTAYESMLAIVENVCEDGKITLGDAVANLLSIPGLVKDIQVAVKLESPIVLAELTDIQMKELGGAALVDTVRFINAIKKLFVKA